jgi:hypothetical protein
MLKDHRVIPMLLRVRRNKYQKPTKEKTMGSRMTQVIGLTEQARKIVQGQDVLAYTEQGEKLMPNGSKEPFSRSVYKSDVSSSEVGSFSGMFGEEYPLYQHDLPDGRTLVEEVQAEPWSSGPCIFVALKENGKWLEESLWSDEEIENA